MKVLKILILAALGFVGVWLGLVTCAAFTDETIDGAKPDYTVCSAINDDYRRLFQARGAGFSRGDVRGILDTSRRVCDAATFGKHRAFICEGVAGICTPRDFR